MPKKLNTEQWISLLPEKQTNWYTYQDAVYTGADNLIEITCPEHGNFWQSAYSHKKGSGCPKCYAPLRGASQKDDVASFTLKATSGEHKDTYDYSEVVYVSSIKPVIIKCRKHGPFKMTPGNHLSGKGCQECYNERRGELRRSNAEEFAQGGNIEHASSYTYEKVIYITSKDKVEITCPIHGSFWQTPDTHLQGGGCPCCNVNGYTSGKPGWLYVLISDHVTKVGITNRTPKHRAKEVSKSSGQSFEVFAAFYFKSGGIPRRLEKTTLKWLQDKYTREYRSFDGSTECFQHVELYKLINFITPLATPESV
jgi:protein-arginine kinase activator protein McsA